MKLIVTIFFLSYYFIGILSCTRTNNLSIQEYGWMPYIGNETLIFQSNSGNFDTIFLLQKDTNYGYTNQYSAINYRYDVLSVFCRHTDEYIDGKKYYADNHLLQIIKGRNKDAEFNLKVLAEDACLYRLSKISLDSLGRIKPIRLVTQNQTFDDVYIIPGEDHSGYGKRSNFITKAYWSKAHGLIRYDKKDSIYWELSKKY